MHEPKASTLSYRDRYCIVRVHHIKHKILEKCDINVLLLVIGDPLANHMPFACAIHYHSST